jgi:Ima1 N-terminal domain
LKNQNIYVTTLSTYFPDPSDPRYAEYEARFPEFKASLEKRYPQVCADCVSLVNNRLQSMSYLTRAENLRVTLDKTRRGLVPRRRRGWRDLAIFLGSLAWFGSILCQFLWHLMGVTLVQSAGDEQLPQCLLLLVKRTTNPACLAAVDHLLPLAHKLGLASLWWNNRLLDSVHGAGRLSKLNDYYFLQVVFLGIRFFAYRSIGNMDEHGPSEAAHAFMLVFIAVVSPPIVLRTQLMISAPSPR